MYENTNSLRYGRVLFMTDQDLDGSHIKGLCINMFQCLWPSLLKLDGFLGFMNTPILKATKGDHSVSFYNEAEYEAWKEAQPNAESWKIKYYKGLGTSTGKEFKEYFQARDQCIVRFREEDEMADSLDMVFNKKKAEQRKAWLSGYDRAARVDMSQKELAYSDFVHKEMIHFSKHDCDRSIPNLMDGLKTSQRKILFAAFKKNLVHEIKVAQFSGYVSENSGYHHGEASLNGAIKNMAQDYVGSNNINLFYPSGQFGTRLQGGEDSASVRYIFTRLQTITRLIFNKKDDAVLNYLDDDGVSVEPDYYAPILPMVLVNGCKGIGTGFSTEIPCFNPRDLVHYLMATLRGEKPMGVDFVPFYRGFKGTIERDGESRFITRGVYRLADTELTITELPIGVWNVDFKKLLDDHITEGIVRKYSDLSTDTSIHYVVTLTTTSGFEDLPQEAAAEEDDSSTNSSEGSRKKAKKTKTTLAKTFKLTSSLSITNMNLFDSEERLVHFDRVSDIIDAFYVKRLEIYHKRKAHELEHLKAELVVLQNKVNYISEILNETLDLRKKTSHQIQETLREKGYALHSGSYHYLTKMSMDSVCMEKVDSLNKAFAAATKEHDELEAMPVEAIWLQELQALEQAFEF